LSRRWLPISRHEITEDDRQAVLRVLSNDTDIARGREIRAFEEELAAYVGARYAVACSSGTAALWLALRTIRRDRVDVPAITFAATRNAVRIQSQTIVDVDSDTGLGVFTEARRALPVHYAGQIAQSDGLFEIEDAAHALGSSCPGGTLVGAGPSLTCFSFHPTKTITTGEGGAVTTDDEGAAQEMRRLRNNGIVRSKAHNEPWFYDNSGFGLNWDMSEMQAALGRSQLGRINSILDKRRLLAYRYIEKLPEQVRPIIDSYDAARHNACHIFPTLVEFEALDIPRERVFYELARRGIEAQVHYIPLERGLPGAEAFYARELTLPLHCRMSVSDVEYVCESLAEILG